MGEKSGNRGDGGENGVRVGGIAATHEAYIRDAA